MGHEIIKPVPSLFTFNIKDELIQGLEGITINAVECTINDTKIETNGSILITHTGLSGPAILKLSAFGARLFNDKNYQFEITINWIQQSMESAIQHLISEKEIHAKKQAGNFTPFALPNRFWLKVLEINGIKSANPPSPYRLKNQSGI